MLDSAKFMNVQPTSKKGSDLLAWYRWTNLQGNSRWCNKKRQDAYKGCTTRPVRQSAVARPHSNTFTGTWSDEVRMMVTMTARLDRNAKMAKGMLTTIRAMSLAYTDLTPMASRIHEGKQSEDYSRSEAVLFVNELFKISLILLINVLLISMVMFR